MGQAHPIHQREVLVDGVLVRVRWRDYPPAREVDASAAVVVLPGWSLSVTSRSCQPLYRAFADRSGRRAVAMDARPEQIVGDSLGRQAKALGSVLRERGLRRVVVAGHSQGGALAANLAAYLAQEAPELAVEGLILLDPIGLFSQGKTHLIVAFLVDALVATPIALLRHITRQPRAWPAAIQALWVAADLIRGLAAAVAAAGGLGCYWRRFAAEVACLARANPHLAEVLSAVVLIQGAGDRVSDPYRQAWAGAAARNDRASRLFPRAARVCSLVATKLGLHGLPLLRPDTTAGAALAMLARWRRPPGG